MYRQAFGVADTRKLAAPDGYIDVDLVAWKDRSASTTIMCSSAAARRSHAHPQQVSCRPVLGEAGPAAFSGGSVNQDAFAVLPVWAVAAVDWSRVGHRCASEDLVCLMGTLWTSEQFGNAPGWRSIRV